jgi:hypothetical protein
MAIQLKLKSGVKANLPSSGLLAGEPLYSTNTQELYIATSTTEYAPAAIDISSYGAIGAVATDDLLVMYDVSTAATAVHLKQITFADFKTALNIPSESTDEKVACASGATAGYLGTNGTDGVLRCDAAGLKMVAGGSNAFVTLGLYFASEAQGDIIYRGASAYARLGAGTAGGILQTGGAGANPSWITVIDGGTF